MFKITPVTIKSILSQESMPAMPALANLWAVEDDAIIGLDLSFSYVYELVPPDLTTRSEAETTGFIQQVRRFIDTVPAGTVVQFIVRFANGDAGLLKQYQGTITASDEIGRLVVDAKLAHLSGLAVHNRKTYLTITAAPPGGEDIRKAGARFFAVNLKDHKPITRAVHEQNLKNLNSVSG
ncbi:MAG TPA: hypothetical protein PLL10_09895, partial [Elusimicrobiales bacterium]|nr:hypothetical protein [Elusimicrobiales bacterium]